MRAIYYRKVLPSCPVADCHALKNLFLFLLLITFVPVSSSAAEETVKASIILAGDGGNPNAKIINTLAYHAKLHKEVTSVFMLGDNIYDIGLPEKQHSLYKESKSRLNKQIKSLKGRANKIVFIPGNHDWDNSAQNGRQYLKNQQDFVIEKLGEGSFAPLNACPGPQLVHETDLFKVIVFDSQWWQHAYDKPDSPEDGCKSFDQKTIQAELKKLTATENKKIIFLQHHPIFSANYIDSETDCYMDPECKKLKSMREFLGANFKDKKAFLCGFGHDHSLQHIKDKHGCENIVVSGTISNYRKIKNPEVSTYAASEIGFFRLDFLSNQKIRLQAIGLDSHKQAGKILYQVYLQ